MIKLKMVYKMIAKRILYYKTLNLIIKKLEEEKKLQKTQLQKKLNKNNKHNNNKNQVYLNNRVKYL